MRLNVEFNGVYNGAPCLNSLKLIDIMKWLLETVQGQGSRGVMIFEEESNCLSRDFYLTLQYISTEQKHGKNHTFLFLRIREEG